MRKTLLLLVMIMALAVPAMCELSGDNKASAIPVPEGALVLTSGSLDNPQINAGIDHLAMSEPSPASLQPNITKLKQALAQVKAVQYVTMKLSGDQPMSELISFFETNVPGRRVIYNIDDTGYLLIATEDGGYFGVVIADLNELKWKEIIAARVLGAPNLGKAVGVVAPLFFFGSESTMSGPAPVRSMPKKLAAKKPVPTKPKRK